MFRDRYNNEIHVGDRIFVCYAYRWSDKDHSWLTAQVTQIEAEKRTVKVRFDNEAFDRNAMKEQCVHIDAPEMLIRLLTES
jgi:hypothetical protein